MKKISVLSSSSDYTAWSILICRAHCDHTSLISDVVIEGSLEDAIAYAKQLPILEKHNVYAEIWGTTL